MSATDKIVYSQTLYRALWESSDSFTTEGEFTTTCYEYDYDGIVPYEWGVSVLLPEHINVSKSQYYQSRKKLFEAGYFNRYGVRMIDGVTESYFELKTSTGLNGLRLIIYSYLANKSEIYGWVDKYHRAIAKELNIAERVFQRNLAELKAMGLVETMERDKQTLIRTI